MKKYALLVVMLAFAACSSDGDKKDAVAKEETPKKREFKTDNLICPQVAIISEGQEIADFGGEKPDLAQLVAVARMENVEGDCGYTKEGIDIKFKLHLKAKRGSRLGGNEVNFPYFVAIVDPAQDVLNRQVMTAHFKFSDTEVESEEPLHVFLPLSQEAMQAGPDYRVLLGFIKPR